MAKSRSSKDDGASGKAAKKAPAKTPFTKAELNQFKKLLLERRKRILATVADMEEEALKAADQDFSVDHMADHGSDNFEQDLTLTLVESERTELYEIERALMRIDNGTYGICEGTGEAIGRPRLEAIPYARYSITYQRKVEAGEVDEDDDSSEE